MGEKRGPGGANGALKAWVKTSLKIDPAVYSRAQHYKVDQRAKGKTLGEMVSQALDEYLKKHGA